MSYPAIVSYDWDFGDGTTSSQQNPSHQYTTEGRYVVTLTVTDADGNTASRTHYIHVSRYPAINSYAWDFNDGDSSTKKNPSHEFDEGDYEISFTVTDADGNTATRTIFIRAGKAWGASSYAWTFGDGGASSQQAPSHIYSDSGFYTVSLTVKDQDGTATRTYFMRVHGTGTYTKRLWQFGDGETSEQQNPQHVYMPGTWTPTLTVYDGNENNSISKPNLIQVSGFVITATPTQGKAQLKVRFRI